VIITNVMGLPEALVRAVDSQPHNKPGQVSVTTLLKGTKDIILTERHWDEIEVDVADLVNIIFGKATHKTLETEGVDTFAEEGLSAEIDGVTVTGTMDSYDMAAEIVDDYKTASVWKVIFKDYKDWEMQGKGYGWLLRLNGFKVKKARFTALLKDHKKTEARRDSTYPQKPCVVHEFPITDADVYEFERFARAKISEIKNFRVMADDAIPPCRPDERWAKETTFAVMKEGRKSAIKVCATKEEADKVSAENNGSFVVERVGDDTKCMGYCNVAPFCSYYREKYGKGEINE